MGTNRHKCGVSRFLQGIVDRLRFDLVNQADISLPAIILLTLHIEKHNEYSQLSLKSELCLCRFPPPAPDPG